MNKLRGVVPANNGSDFTSGVHGMYATGASPTGFCRTFQLKVADFSFNFLIGSIPKCWVTFQNLAFKEIAFSTKIQNNGLLLYVMDVSEIVVEGPRCSLRSRKVYSDLYVDYLKMFLLNVPAAVVALGLFFFLDDLTRFEITIFWRKLEDFKA